MRQFWILGVVLVGSVVVLASGDVEEASRQKRSRKSVNVTILVISSNTFMDSLSLSRPAFGVFSIIRFPNDACEGTGNKNGTCYTPEECENKGGTNSGSCASGYGVCCTCT